MARPNENAKICSASEQSTNSGGLASGIPLYPQETHYIDVLTPIVAAVEIGRQQ